MTLEKNIPMEGIPSFKIPDTDAISKATNQASLLSGNIRSYLSAMGSYKNSSGYHSDGYYISGGSTPSTKFEEIYNNLYDGISDLAINDEIYANYKYAAKDKAKEIIEKNLDIAYSKRTEVYGRINTATYYGNSPSSYDLDLEKKLNRDINKLKDIKGEI